MRKSMILGVVVVALAATVGSKGATATVEENSTPRARFVHRLQELQSQETVRIAAIEAELRGTNDPVHAEQLQAQLRGAKSATELALLQLQVDFARESGNAELVERLERSIAAIQSPRFRATSLPGVQIPEQERRR